MGGSRDVSCFIILWAEAGTYLVLSFYVGKRSCSFQYRARARCAAGQNVLPSEPVGVEVLKGVLPDGNAPGCSGDLQKTFSGVG